MKTNMTGMQRGCLGVTEFVFQDDLTARFYFSEDYNDVIMVTVYSGLRLVSGAF